MKEDYINQIIEFVKSLSENQILYVLTLIKNLMGSH